MRLISTCSAAHRCSSGSVLAPPSTDIARLPAGCCPRLPHPRSCLARRHRPSWRRSTTGASSWPRSACWRRPTGPTRSPRSGAGRRARTRHCAASRVIKAAVYVIVASLWIFGGLHFSGVMPNSIWGIPLLAGIALSFATAHAVTRVFDEAGTGERTLAQYASIFEHIDSQRFTSTRLAALQQSMSADGRPAPVAMRALNRILSFADLRRGAALLHFPIQAFTLWDFHCLFALESWRRSAGARVHTWFEAAAELDALSCLAAVRHDYPDWCDPASHRRRRAGLSGCRPGPSLAALDRDGSPMTFSSGRPARSCS